MFVPERIGPYEVLRELGRGGMGVVYEARQPQLDRRVALKQVLIERASPTALTRFLREAEVLARVQHVSVVRIHELAQSPEGPYLVEELVEGQPLSKAGREGLGFQEIARIVRDLADALEVVHQAGIVHRDVKPQNVMLRPDGRAVLLDFGLARDVNAEQLTRTHEVMGTVAYMPPEQANGESARLDGRSDVYSLGAVLYELLLGRPPYRGAVPVMLKKILESDPPWPRAERSEVPAGLDAICRRAMARSREQRYPSAAAFRDDLDRWLAGQTPEALRGVRLRRVVLLVPLVLGAAVAAALLLRPGQPPDAGGVASPASARLAPPEPEVETLWDLAGPLAYRLTLAERTLQGEVEFAATLKLQEPRREKGRALYTSQVARLSITSTSDAETWTWSSSDPPDHAMAALGEVAGRPFAIRVELATGAVEMEGWRGISAKVLERIPEFGRASGPAKMIERLLTDEFLGASMDALLHARRNEKVPWVAQEGDWGVEVASGPPAILPLTIDRGGDERFKLEGTATWSGGSVARASLTQTRVGKGQPVVTRWSMEREE